MTMVRACVIVLLVLATTLTATGQGQKRGFASEGPFAAPDFRKHGTPEQTYYFCRDQKDFDCAKQYAAIAAAVRLTYFSFGISNTPGDSSVQAMGAQFSKAMFFFVQAQLSREEIKERLYEAARLARGFAEEMAARREPELYRRAYKRAWMLYLYLGDEDQARRMHLFYSGLQLKQQEHRTRDVKRLS